MVNTIHLLTKSKRENMKANNGVGKTVCKQAIPERRQPGLDREVIRAGRVIYERLIESIKDERDITREAATPLRHILRRYTNTFEYPDGWRVSKVLLPDRATKHGAGYHKISIVTSTVETEQGVSEAIQRAIEVKTKLEKSQAHITAETVIVLSHHISFALANRLRVLLSTPHRKIFIYSVKNAIGVAKNALKKFANLFTIRARKIKDLPRLREEMQILSDALLKRGEKLFGHVTQLTKALSIMTVPKKQLRKAKDAAWKFLAQARDWGVNVWINKEDWLDINTIYDKISFAAQLQGIDLFEIEQVGFREEAKRRMNQLSPG